jgi:hypothetical protein
MSRNFQVVSTCSSGNGGGAGWAFLAKAFLRQVQHHGAVLADRVQHHRASHSATTSRRMWMLSASRRCRWVRPTCTRGLDEPWSGISRQGMPCWPRPAGVCTASTGQSWATVSQGSPTPTSLRTGWVGWMRWVLRPRPFLAPHRGSAAPASGKPRPEPGQPYRSATRFRGLRHAAPNGRGLAFCGPTERATAAESHPSFT